METQRDYYEILGVSREADGTEIKRAYRKVAMQFHPDRNPDNPDAESKFKEASLAYEILKDDQKRAAYDQFGHAAFADGGPGGMGGMGGGPGGFDFGGSFADIFEEMFGEFTGRGTTHRGRGADVRYNLTMSLEEAFHGKTESLTTQLMAGCELCDGTGAKPGSGPVVCPTCDGQGKIRTNSGFFMVQRTCPTCQGLGEIIEDPCDACGGTGRQRREKKLSVNIPAGVEEGTRIRVSNEGEVGRQNGPPGDLYVFISIKPHPLFKRHQEDLFCRVPIPMTTAALGGELEVPLIDGGKARVNIPGGTQSGSQFRLRGKGMTVLKAGRRGDMFVEAIVETPVKLTKQQKQLLQEFAEESKEAEDAHPESHGFLRRVKEFWDGLKESDTSEGDGAEAQGPNSSSAKSGEKVDEKDV